MDMEILNWIVLIAGFCLIPAGVLQLCRRFPLLGKIGPVLLLYDIGLIIGNLGLMPGQMPAVQELLSNAMVPLAIPLMLFSCTFKMSGARSQVLALVTGIISVATAVVVGYLIFGADIPEGTKVGGMLTGVYTGGTINLAALKTMLGVDDETYILINSYDILVSFLYLSFLLAVGIKLFFKLGIAVPEFIEQQIDQRTVFNISHLFSLLYSSSRRVTKSTSSRVEIPASTFRRASSRKLLIPLRRANSRRVTEFSLAKIILAISSVITKIS